jgi:two-component system CitB family sensor kinase
VLPQVVRVTIDAQRIFGSLWSRTGPEKVTQVRRRMSLAGQLLMLQLVIISIVLVAVAAVSLAQSDASFRAVEGRRALSAAEHVATQSLVRRGLEVPKDRGVAQEVAGYAENVSGSSYVVVATVDGTIIASADASQLGRKLDLHGSPALAAGTSWVGVVDDGRGKAVVAHVPVLADGQWGTRMGKTIGVVAVGREYPSWLESLATATPNLLTYLGLATAVGVVGSLLVARRVKRQTLGLEPREIAGLAEHREALLHGIKEGVIALDPQRRITLVNDEATRLLRLPEDTVGRSLAELDLPGRLADVLAGVDGTGADSIVLRGGRVLVLNRMPVSGRGRELGAVVTLRDRTELDTLTDELHGARSTTEALRSQAHEFANRMHTVAGLIELEEYDEALRFATSTTAAHEALARAIADRIEEPALAALLLAKSAEVTERGAQLVVAEDSWLGRDDVGDPEDLLLVVGNLVDNALDALGGGSGWIRVTVRSTEEGVLVEVRDSGPGVAPELADEVFRHGFTTKVAQSGGARGLGLALTRQACVRRGGWVRVRNEDGAVFTALLPPARVATR